ncbi:DUF3078 domain-containing protein [Bacteroidota bacterium]
MKYLLINFLLFFSVISLAAQESDSIKSNWDNKGIVSLNISQIAFTDWTQGGDNAITYSFMGDFTFNYKEEKWSFINSLKMAYGQTKIANDDFKTNDNEFYLESVYSRDINLWVDPYVSNIVRTTIASGYNYAKSGKTQTSAFFDPGYISQSIGVGLNKSEIVKTRLGLGFQETFTNKFRNYSNDPETLDKEEAFKFETGIESVTDVQWGFMENMMFKSKLRLFTRFVHLDVWDVRWDNIISAQVNKYIVVNLNVLVIYEKSQTARTQMKEALQLGITYTLF